jgi:DNA invertase Pin-like site-specific DNA recombinase
MTDPLFAPGNGARQLEGDLRSPPPTTPNGADAPPMPRAVRPVRVGLRDGEPVIGYVTAPGEPDAAGTYPSQRAIEQACQRAGWRLLDVLHDIDQRRTAQRPALSSALQRIADGEARGLVVSHARLLGDSIVDLAALMRWFGEARAAFIALDLGLDTSTPQGTRVAMALIRLSGWDRGGVVNGQRRGQAELRPHNGWHRNGSHRPAPDDGRAELLRRLAAMEDDDMSLQEMADQLNADGVPPLNGSKTWWPSGVRTALRYARAQRLTQADGLSSLHHRAR